MTDQIKRIDHVVAALLYETLMGLYCMVVGGGVPQNRSLSRVSCGLLLKGEEVRGTPRREGAYVSS